MSEDVVAKYVGGEETPPTVVEVSTQALRENPDGTVTATLLVEKISGSVATEITTPYGKGGNIWSHGAVRPSGLWPIHVTLPDMETAQSLAGVAEVGKEVIEFFSDMHRLLIRKYQDESLAVKTPGDNVKFNR